MFFLNCGERITNEDLENEFPYNNVLLKPECVNIINSLVK